MLGFLQILHSIQMTLKGSFFDNLERVSVLKKLEKIISS